MFAGGYLTNATSNSVALLTSTDAAISTSAPFNKTDAHFVRAAGKIFLSFQKNKWPSSVKCWRLTRTEARLLLFLYVCVCVKKYIQTQTDVRTLYVCLLVQGSCSNTRTAMLTSCQHN